MNRAVRRSPALTLVAVLTAGVTTAACGGGSPPSALPATIPNATMCRAFALTVNEGEPLQYLAASVASAGTSVSYKLRRDLAAFITDGNGGPRKRPATQSMQVRRDCLSIQVPAP